MKLVCRNRLSNGYPRNTYHICVDPVEAMKLHLLNSNGDIKQIQKVENPTGKSLLIYFDD